MEIHKWPKTHMHTFTAALFVMVKHINIAHPYNGRPCRIMDIHGLWKDLQDTLVSAKRSRSVIIE